MIYARERNLDTAAARNTLNELLLCVVKVILHDLAKVYYAQDRQIAARRGTVQHGVAILQWEFPLYQECS